ncbi:MAG: lysophospholipid acyltransferase family protein, partial [Anaerolineae bacterium]
MKDLSWYRVVDVVARRLPRRTAYGLVRPATAWVYRRRPALRRTLAANLARVLEAGGPDSATPDLDRLVRRNFENFGKYLVDFFRFCDGTAEPLDRLVTVAHGEHLDRCRALGRGILGLTAHIGNWELGAPILAGRGCPVTAVVWRPPSPELDTLFQSRRRNRGIRVVPMGGSTREVLAALGRNEFVAMLADRDYSGRGHRVPFFGRPARLPRGPAVLAVRSGAPLLPAFLLRREDDTYCFEMHPPLLPEPHQSVDELQFRICAVL